MRKAIEIIVSLCIVSFMSSDSVKVSAKSYKWKLIFFDDFTSSDGKVDTAKWCVPNREPYKWSRWISTSDSVVFLKDGILFCRSIPNTFSSDSAKMLTGAVCSKGKFAFKYGKLEVRMRTNKIQGNFPAVWLLPESPGRPYRYGEIDVVEFFGTDNQAYQTIHSHRSFIVGKSNQKMSYTTTVDPTQWHVYGMEWSPLHIAMFIDGKLIGSFVKSSDPNILNEGQWTFDRPYYLILNQSVGDDGWNTPYTNRIYQTEFDWIKVYQ